MSTDSRDESGPLIPGSTRPALTRLDGCLGGHRPHLWSRLPLRWTVGDLRVSVWIHTSILWEGRGSRDLSQAPYRTRGLDPLEVHGPRDGSVPRPSRGDILLETCPLHPIESDNFVRLSTKLTDFQVDPHFVSPGGLWSRYLSFPPCQVRR